MHATPHTNLFGITTHYGTHPAPPRRALRQVARSTATTLIAAAILVKQRLAKTK